MSSPLARYESFLIDNVSTISTLESTLRSITWFLPGRFKDAELASEALAALLNLMSLYHDTLLRRILEADPKFKPVIPPSAHTRYTRAWSDNDVRYRWAARALEVTRFLELVVEMGLRRRVSNKNRWRGIVLLEFMKAILRLYLLKITRRPLISPPIPERDFDLASLPTNTSNTSSPTLVPCSASSSLRSTPEHLKNNHISHDPPHPLLTTPPHHCKSPVEAYLLPKALTPSSVKTPTSLVKPLSSPKDWLAEVTYVLRPIIYVILLSSDRRSSRPLITSLTFEIISRHLRRIPPASSVLERSEYARRDRDILWYVVRDSIWQSYTRPKLEAFVRATAHAPILGIISAFIKDWMPLIDDYYYYTAT